MLTKEISEVEKELELEFESKYPLDSLDYIKRKDKLIHLRAKLSTLKSAQAKFDKLKQKIEEITSWTCYCNCVTFDNKKCRRCGSSPNYGEIDYDEMIKLLDELSSKQEEKE
jgi:hypothetical protein